MCSTFSWTLILTSVCGIDWGNFLLHSLPCFYSSSVNYPWTFLKCRYHLESSSPCEYEVFISVAVKWEFSFSLLPFESFSPLTVPDLQSAMITKFPSFQKTSLLCKLYPAPVSVCVSVCVCLCVSRSVCLTLCDPMDYSSPGSSVHDILQVRISEWVAMLSPGISCTYLLTLHEPYFASIIF